MNNHTNLNDDKMESFAEATVKYNIEKKLRSKYDKILVAKKKSTKRDKRVIKMINLLKMVAILVAVVACTFAIQNTLFSPSLKSIAKNHLDQTNISGNPDITRKGANSSSQLQRQANDAYLLKNYNQAIAKYEELQIQRKSSLTDQFYLGICYLKTENYPEAITVFSELDNIEQGQVQEIDWLLSLSYVLSSQEKKAIPILKDITLQNRYKSKEAKILLAKIN